MHLIVQRERERESFSLKMVPTIGSGCQNFSRQFNDDGNDNDYSKLAPDPFKGDLSIASRRIRRREKLLKEYR